MGTNHGWICPKCGRGYAPFCMECPHCNGEGRPERAEESAASRPTGPIMGVSAAQMDVERCAAQVSRETNPPGGKTGEQLDAERAAMLGRWKCRGCSTELAMVAEPGMYDRPLDTPWSWAPLGQRWEHRCPGQGLFYVTDRIGRAEGTH